MATSLPKDDMDFGPEKPLGDFGHLQIVVN
jgi:hypothetical protein